MGNLDMCNQEWYNEATVQRYNGTMVQWHNGAMEGTVFDNEGRGGFFPVAFLRKI